MRLALTLTLAKFVAAAAICGTSLIAAAQSPAPERPRATVSAAEAEPARPTFGGSADMSEPEVGRLMTRVGLDRADFAPGRSVANSVGFAVYDRARRVVISSFNLDRAFNLASTTKLFTMAVVGRTFGGDRVLAARRHELARILRVSDNLGASRWLLLAQRRDAGKPFDYPGHASEVKGNCYGGPNRDEAQKVAELAAATAFFARHRAMYAIDWTGAQVVDGAGCERAGMWEGGEDRMTPRQYLTVLDQLRHQDFAGWNALELMPQMTSDGRVLDRRPGRAESMHQGYIAWKTGTDSAGIKNIAGYIPSRSDPFAFYFVLLVNSGRSPADGGLINGARVARGFAAWAASTARAQR